MLNNWYNTYVGDLNYKAVSLGKAYVVLVTIPVLIMKS